jgi:endonuclease/exonuclease/phosphatase (EEP) superfamily protein YafD
METGSTRGVAARRRRADWVWRLSLLNLLGILALWAVQRGVGEGYWLTALLVYVPQAPFAIPTALLALAALGRGRWRALGLNLVAAVACAVLLLKVAVPVGRIAARSAAGGPTARAASPTLRVLTFNIWHAGGGVSAVIGTIQRARPDVFCLQEAVQGNGNPRDPVPAITRAFPRWHTARRGEYLVASRYPVRRMRVLPLGPTKKHRSMLEVVLDVRGRPVTVYNVHFKTAVHPESILRHRGSLAHTMNRTAAVRRAQAEVVARRALANRGPTLVCGDFNSPPGSYTLRRLEPRFRDSFGRAGLGLGYTYPARRPLLRIDYVLASPEFAIRECQALPMGGSDHRAVVAELALGAS